MASVNQAPVCKTETATQLAWEIYGLRASGSPLPSERDQNFLLQTKSGEQFVLKLANALEDRTFLQAQNLALQHVARSLSFCPRIVASRSGELITEIQTEAGTQHLARLLTWVPGVPVGAVRRRSPELLIDLGRKFGQLDRALEGFDHPAIHRDFHWDLARGLKTFHDYKTQIADPAMRALAQKIASDFENRCVPLLSSLRRSAIHNDANDYNVLAGG